MKAKDLAQLIYNKEDRTKNILIEGTIKGAFIKVWYDACQAMRDELVKEGIHPEKVISPSFPKDRY